MIVSVGALCLLLYLLLYFTLATAYAVAIVPIAAAAAGTDEDEYYEVDDLEEIHTAIVNNDYNQVSQVLLPELLSLVSIPADSSTSSWRTDALSLLETFFLLAKVQHQKVASSSEQCSSDRSRSTKTIPH